MVKNETGIAFSVICHRSRRNEFKRIVVKSGGRVFPESQPVFRHTVDQQKEIVGQLMGGTIGSNNHLAQLQQEVAERKIGLSPLQRVDEMSYGGARNFQCVLADRNRMIWSD